MIHINDIDKISSYQNLSNFNFFIQQYNNNGKYIAKTVPISSYSLQLYNKINETIIDTTNITLDEIIEYKNIINILYNNYNLIYEYLQTLSTNISNKQILNTLRSNIINISSDYVLFNTMSSYVQLLSNAVINEISCIDYIKTLDKQLNTITNSLLDLNLSVDTFLTKNVVDIENTMYGFNISKDNATSSINLIKNVFSKYNNLNNVIQNESVEISSLSNTFDTNVTQLCSYINNNINNKYNDLNNINNNTKYAIISTDILSNNIFPIISTTNEYQYFKNNFFNIKTTFTSSREIKRGGNFTFNINIISKYKKHSFIAAVVQKYINNTWIEAPKNKVNNYFNIGINTAHKYNIVKNSININCQVKIVNKNDKNEIFRIKIITCEQNII